MALIDVKVITGAKKSGVVGWDGSVLRVKVAAQPESGKANKELVALLAAFYNIPPSSIQIKKGEHARRKVLEIGIK